MSMLPGFLLRVARATSTLEQGAGGMTIIIKRAYAYLEKELCRTFEGQKDVTVIVDRRGEKRRRSHRPVTLERRRADRRSPKEELVEVVLSA